MVTISADAVGATRRRGGSSPGKLAPSESVGARAPRSLEPEDSALRHHHRRPPGGRPTGYHPARSSRSNSATPQIRLGIRTAHHFHAPQASSWCLSVRRSTINPAEKLCHCYQTRPPPKVIQLWEGIRVETQVLAPEENYWRLSLPRSTISPI